MLTGLNSFVEGTLYRESSLPTADLTIRKLNAIEALARYGKSKARASNDSFIQPNLLPTSAVWIGGVFCINYKAFQKK